MSIKRPGARVATLLALLLSMALPTGLAMAQEPELISAGAGTGTAIISDGTSLGDTITVAMEDVPSVAAGTALEGWLVGDNGDDKLSVGVMAVAADGTIAHVFVSADGENLTNGYNKFVVTVEPVPDTDPDPSDVVAFSHRIPLSSMAHIRHLLTDWPPGSGTGILSNLQIQIQAAITHAQLAIDSDTLEEVQLNTHHVINIIEGTDGANFDGSFGNPGDGLGVLLHASDAEHATFAAGESPDDTMIAEHAALVESAGGNAASHASSARDEALVSLGQSTLFLAKLQLSPVVGFLSSALNGLDSNADGTISSAGTEGGAAQAYVEAQLMATYTLTAGGLAPVGPELGIGLSNTGDKSVATMAMLALAAALVLILGGGAMVMRSSRVRNDR